MGPVGVQEMIVIFVIALVLFGPKKLPELGRTLGKAFTEFKRAQSELKATFEHHMSDLEKESQSIKQATSGYTNDSYNHNESYNHHDSPYYDAGAYGSESYDSNASNSSTVSASATQGAESIPAVETVPATAEEHAATPVNGVVARSTEAPAHNEHASATAGDLHSADGSAVKS